MSIVIKTQQLNIIIYKYLLQSNLTHTAFALFHQALLEQSLNQFKFDVKSAHLVNLIEKALTFAQIQSHITMSQYELCKEPFHLLKQHVCKITEKAKQQKDSMLKQFNQNLFSTIRRTSSVHNTLQPNFEDIIYEQRSANFFDRIPLKIEDSQTLQIKISKGSCNKFFCINDSDTNTITIMNKKDNFLQTIGVYPCSNKLHSFEVVENLLILVDYSNVCQIINLLNGNVGQTFSFKLPLIGTFRAIKVNKKLKSIVAFETEEEFCIINANSRKELAKGNGQMEWLGFYNYLVLDRNAEIVRRFSLKGEIDDGVKQFCCPLRSATEIKLSLGEIYFYVVSIDENSVFVYNLQQKEPLYIFDFREETVSNAHDSGDDGYSLENLIQVLWASSNEADKLIFITDLSIKAFQIDLNNFSKIYEISDYDNEIKKGGLLRKKESQGMYLVMVGLENLLIYDVDLNKMERIQYSQQQSISLFELDDNQYLGLQIDNKLLLTQPTDFQPLFL